MGDIASATTDSAVQSVTYGDGRSLAYTDYGDPNGFPILVQHGLIASIRDVSLFRELAMLGARIISLARPGYGESSPYHMHSIGEWADLVSVLVEKQNLSRFDVFGISSGAPYAYALGWKYPDRVRNLFILSGIPALYDDEIASHWQYPLNRNASFEKMSGLAADLFFSNLSPQDLGRNDIQDSMRNNAFGIARDLCVRANHWGFELSEVTAHVNMQHSTQDPAVPFITAQMTARRLPNCTFTALESDIHFSQDLLNEYTIKTIAPHYQLEKT